MSKRILLTALAILLVPSAASAQRADTTALSREAVRSILRFYSGPGDMDILVGDRMPRSVASRVSLPPGARVIATLVGADTQVIASVRGTADSIRMWFAEEFELRGYLPGRSLGPGQIAFRPAERSPSTTGYCGSGQHFTVSAKSVAADSVEFQLRLQPSEDCDPEVAWWAGNFSMGSGPDLPLLYHPRSAEVRRECTEVVRMGGREQRTDASVSTRIHADEMMSHYAAQLDSLGWRRDSLPSAIATWTRADSTGRDMRLLLSIEPGDGGRDCRILRMSTVYLEP